jgi:hypothetical protein
LRAFPALRQSRAVAFDAIGLSGETLFPSITSLRRFICFACGSRRVHLRRRRRT